MSKHSVQYISDLVWKPLALAQHAQSALRARQGAQVRHLLGPPRTALHGVHADAEPGWCSLTQSETNIRGPFGPQGGSSGPHEVVSVVGTKFAASLGSGQF